MLTMSNIKYYTTIQFKSSAILSPIVQILTGPAISFQTTDMVLYITKLFSNDKKNTF